MSVSASGEAAVVYSNESFPVPAYFYFTLFRTSPSVTVHVD